MDLEPLCDMSLQYDDEGFDLVRPYGGEEGSAYGTGRGRVEGERLAGDVRWANHPHRRGDETMLPDAAGVIHTDDDALVVFRMAGRTIWSEDGSTGGQVLHLTMEAEQEPYRWLNDVVCLVEGTIEVEKLEMRASVFVCRHPSL